MAAAKRYITKATKDGAEVFTRTALFFRREQLEKLQALSAVSGAPVAELVRRAVDMYLEHRKTEWQPLMKK